MRAVKINNGLLPHPGRFNESDCTVDKLRKQDRNELKKNKKIKIIEIKAHGYPAAD